MILIDTSGLLAAVDRCEIAHAAASAAIRFHKGPRLLSPFVLAELDYLVLQRLRPSAQDALLEEVGRGAYQLELFSASDILEAREIIERYRDLPLSLADASIAVLAHRHGAQDVLTLDERHFRVLQGPRGPFRLLPADG